MAAGSNGDIAWGFTNSVGDWSDLVIVDPVPGDPTRYQTPDGPRAFDLHQEIDRREGGGPGAVRSALDNLGTGRRRRPPRPASRRSSGWRTIPGCWPPTPRGSPRPATWTRRCACRWARRWPPRTWWSAIAAARSPGRSTARSRGGSASGGDVPTSWADGSRRWDGYLNFDEHPRVVDPPDGRLWTANARVVGGEMLETDRRRRLQRRHPRLDDPRTCSASTRPTSGRCSTSSSTIARCSSIGGARCSCACSTAEAASRFAAAGWRRGSWSRSSWTGRTSADSAAYRIVRNFRLTASRMAFCDYPRPGRRRACAGATGSGAASTVTTIRRIEGPLWRLVSERPAHLLDPGVPHLGRAFCWRRSTARSAQLTAGGRPLAERTWGETNAADIAHPLAAAVPWVGRYL